MNANSNEPTQQKQNNERKLSRKRRYLIFPTGSSIQLGNYILKQIYFSGAIKFI